MITPQYHNRTLYLSVCNISSYEVENSETLLRSQTDVAHSRRTRCVAFSRPGSIGSPSPVSMTASDSRKGNPAFSLILLFVVCGVRILTVYKKMTFLSKLFIITDIDRSTRHKKIILAHTKSIWKCPVLARQSLTTRKMIVRSLSHATFMWRNREI